MEATIGQSVRLYLNGAELKTWRQGTPVQLPGEDHFAATVCYVYPPKQATDDPRINVVAFDHNCWPLTVLNIPLVGPDVQMPADGKPFARWLEKG